MNFRKPFYEKGKHMQEYYKIYFPYSKEYLLEQIKKNTAMILLGAVTVLVIAGFILFVILEIRLWLLEQTLKKQYEQADMD